MIYLIAYGIGWAVCCVLLIGPILDDSYGRPAAADRVLAAVLSIFASLFWPLALPIWGLIQVGKRTSRKEIDGALQDRKQALDDREAEIARMEREMNIGKDDA